MLHLKIRESIQQSDGFKKIHLRLLTENHRTPIEWCSIVESKRAMSTALPEVSLVKMQVQQPKLLYSYNSWHFGLTWYS